jgi:hypothetical protein
MAYQQLTRIMKNQLPNMTQTMGTHKKKSCATPEVSHCLYELANKNLSQSLHIPL